MDDRERLAFYPFVVVRDRLQGLLAQKGLRDCRGWQPNSGRRSACATSSIFPTTACGGRKRVLSRALQPGASTCPDLEQPRPPSSCELRLITSG